MHPAAARLTDQERCAGSHPATAQVSGAFTVDAIAVAAGDDAMTATEHTCA